MQCRHLKRGQPRRNLGVRRDLRRDLCYVFSGKCKADNGLRKTGQRSGRTPLAGFPFLILRLALSGSD
jgi:hypothetical protein